MGAGGLNGSLGTATFSYDWANRLTSMSSPLWTGSLAWSWRLDDVLTARFSRRGLLHQFPGTGEKVEGGIVFLRGSGAGPTG